MNIGRKVDSITGFTLIEMLMAIAIFSVVIGGLFTIGDYVSARVVESRRESKRILEMANFLNEFSDSLEDGKGILYVSAREIGIWLNDKDGDGRPYADETVSFLWDGRSPGTVYRRVGYEEKGVMNAVEAFEIAYDFPPPQTTHVLMRIKVNGTVYQTGMAVGARR